MPESLASLLRECIDREAVHLRTISDAEASIRPSTNAWSQKEELGHLIDSAANNHVRFVRACLETQFQGPAYEQAGWVGLHGYKELSWPDIVDFWYRYNQLLARVVERIPEASMEKSCVIADHSPVMLSFLIEDYVVHMRHHIDRILRRKSLAAAPEQWGSSYWFAAPAMPADARHDSRLTDRSIQSGQRRNVPTLHIGERL